MAPPVFTTTAVAVPLTTEVPRKASSCHSDNPTEAEATGVAVFSAGKDSPVSVDSSTKKSLAAMMRTSAGMRSPAERYTISPGTISGSEISFFAPSRKTLAVVVIRADRLSAAFSAFRSW